MDGTPLAPVEKTLSDGQDVLLEIELKGAWQVLQKRPDAVMIFIMPPSLEELEKRLRGRGTEMEQAIDLRLSRAREEVAEIEADRAPDGGHRFHYVIVNDSVQRASDELAQAILDAREVDEQANDR
jgi:guanylate kinase